MSFAGGGDSEYLGWSYNSFAKYKAKGYCNVEEDNLGFWEPLQPADTEASTAGDRQPASCTGQIR